MDTMAVCLVWQMRNEANNVCQLSSYRAKHNTTGRADYKQATKCTWVDLNPKPLKKQNADTIAINIVKLPIAPKTGAFEK